MAKRRFIKSSENIKSINEINNNIKYSDSDTELCIYKVKNGNNNDNNNKDKYKKSKTTQNINSFRKKNKNSINTFVDKIYSPFHSNTLNNKKNINNKDYLII